MLIVFVILFLMGLVSFFIVYYSRRMEKKSS
ncbi:MAG: DUF3149 domain-containing protein [Candidatus Jordarchaeum sp.]